MKTLALIKNPLFDSFIKIVATDNLEKTLDNPDVPVPFTCLDSVVNQNSEVLLEQLSSYFINHKLSNKDFFNLGEEETTQLTFMMNLIKLSSGIAINNDNNSTIKTNIGINNTTSNNTNTTNNTANNTKTNSSTLNINSSENTEVSTNVSKNVDKPKSTTNDLKTEHEENPNLDELDDPFAIDKSYIKADAMPKHEKEAALDLEDDPFVFKTEAIQSNNGNNNGNNNSKLENSEKIPEVTDNSIFDPFTIPETVKNTTENNIEHSPHHHSIDIITEFNIPKNSIVNFVKNENITAILIDVDHAIFEGETLSLNDAAKSAYKKSGTLGIANGLSNWLYQGTPLKSLKV